MCHRCRTNELCSRIERQVKAIDGDGAVSPAAIRALLVDAHKALSAYITADTVFDLIAGGEASMEVIQVGDMPPHGRPH